MILDKGLDPASAKFLNYNIRLSKNFTLLRFSYICFEKFCNHSYCIKVFVGFFDCFLYLFSPLKFGVKNDTKHINLGGTFYLDIIYFYINYLSVASVKLTYLSLWLIDLQTRILEPFCDCIKGFFHVNNQRFNTCIPSYNVVIVCIVRKFFNIE